MIFLKAVVCRACLNLSKLPRNASGNRTESNSHGMNVALNKWAAKARQWWSGEAPSDPRFTHINREIFKEFNAFRPAGAKPLFCYVPFNSLTFSFQGKVFACTYNREKLLGTYPEQSIREIWTGEEASKLREHMQHNDLDYGCQHCKYFFDKRKFSNLKPMVFDKYADNTAAAYPRVLEFELSNECNLECQMCVGEVSSSIRKNREKLPPIRMPYDAEFVKQLEEFIPHIREAKFFGGEPFLISIYFDIWEKMLSINPSIEFFLITNGTHWNNKIRSILERGHFEIAISIDALNKQKMESIRKNANFDKVIENIHHFNDYARRNNRRISLSFTVQQDNWEEFPKMIEFCNELGAHIYVSYLEWPVKFAISSLPHEKLKEIDTFLSNFSMPSETSFEKHNHRCFEDFRQFVHRLVEEGNPKTYMEYRFSEIMKDTETPQSDSSESSVPLPAERSLEEMEALFLRRLSEVHQGAENEELRESLHKKLGAVLSHFDLQARLRIYARLFSTDFSHVLRSLNELPTEQLIAECRKDADIS